MEWQVAVLIIFSSLVVLMLTGMPIAICFMFINLIGAVLVLGYPAGLDYIIQSMWSSLATFTIAPVPLFVIMGELMFHSGLGGDVVKIVDQWLGRLPGRGSLIAVGSGVILAALTGVSIASVSILGSVLLPQMEKDGYHKSMIFGPILGAAIFIVSRDLLSAYWESWMLVYGMMFVLVILFIPSGILGLIGGRKQTILR